MHVPGPKRSTLPATSRRPPDFLEQTMLRRAGSSLLVAPGLPFSIPTESGGVPGVSRRIEVSLHFITNGRLIEPKFCAAHLPIRVPARDIEVLRCTLKQFFGARGFAVRRQRTKQVRGGAHETETTAFTTVPCALPRTSKRHRGFCVIALLGAVASLPEDCVERGGELFWLETRNVPPMDSMLGPLRRSRQIARPLNGGRSAKFLSQRRGR
jgi:hypothetical protein